MSKDNGFDKLPLGNVSGTALPPTNGFNFCFFSYVSCHNLHPLDANLELALHLILSLVSDLTRNRPWVTGEVQLA